MAKRCRICGRNFPTDIALKSHLKENHRGYYYGVRLAPVIALIILIAALLMILPPGGMTATITSQTTLTVTPPTLPTHTAQTQSSRRPAPYFELPEIDELGLTGRIIKLSSFAGKPVFLEFMSPTCPHCLRMAPIVKELEEKYGDKIIFISIVYPSGGIDYASKVLAKEGLDWLHVVDEKGAAFDAYGVTGTPTYVILDDDHVEAKRIIGETSREALEEAILSVIS